MGSLLLSISAVERETGLTKDTLRKWEVRYGFPIPARDSNGQRFYTHSDLDRLLRVKRLLDLGSRPAKTLPLSLKELTALATEKCEESLASDHREVLDQVWHALTAPDSVALRGALNQALIFNGLGIFVLAIMPPLNLMVSNGWMNGQLAIHQEHIYSETLRNLLLEAISRLQPMPGRARVLLSTPPDERHDLGMLSVQAVLALAGAHCISLGPATPATELSAAAVSHRVQIIALSFSSAYPSRRIVPFLAQVRASLPEPIQIWAGGAGIDNLRKKPPGVHTFATLEKVVSALPNPPSAA